MSMGSQEVHSLGERGPVSTTEATLSSHLSRVDSGAPETLSALQNERAAIKSLLSVVDTRINAFAPVSRLPPELLVTILSYCVCVGDEYDDAIRAMDHVPPTAPWVRFTWVCRRWRHVMLASPMLWRDFVLPLPLQWARTMLDRSQHLPLSISCSHQALPPPQGSPAWQLPFDTLEHVRSIQMSRSAFNGNTTDISRLLSTPAPALEVFSFINMSGYLPREALFANCAPRLRHLTIYGARLLPLSLFSPNLVNLVISHVFLKRPESLSEFIAALQRLSRIEMLTLVGCLHPFYSAPQAPTPSQIAKLPALRCLNIGGTVPQCLGFLRHVQTPDTIVLHVAAHKQGGVNDFTALFPFLTQGSAEDSFRVVKFRSEGPGNLTIFARHNDADYAPWDRNFDFVWGDHEDTVRAFMLVLCAEAGMRHCLSLSIELEDDDPPSETPFRPDEWMDILGAATELQTLQTSGGVGIMLCPTLSATVEDGTYSRTASGSLVWPQLHILKLNDVNFSYRYQAGDGSSWAECTGMRADEVLLRELEHRRQRGAVLEELHLGSCTVDAQWMYKVADVVGRLLADNLHEDL